MALASLWHSRSISNLKTMKTSDLLTANMFPLKLICSNIPPVGPDKAVHASLHIPNMQTGILQDAMTCIAIG